MDKLLESLNPQQQEAITAAPGHLLVLAGAGSGKTRVLVHRIAWLLEQQQVSPYAILAVTFTNKAASEMRARIENLCGVSTQGMWVGTFHGLSHRLLRAHWEAANLPESFQILDSDDQYRLVRRTLRALNLDETKWPPKQAQWFINKCKEDGRRPRDVADTGGDFFQETMLKVYSAYQDVCERSGLVDFSELLLRTLELLRNNNEIATHYSNRFKHILVDEFQDTNAIQYLWLKALAGDDTCMMAVGDDDQSIYSWRGAKIENIHRFSKEFSDTKIVRLEQNYRSTQTILTAANQVISNNRDRMGKELWTSGDEGEKILHYAAFNERDEAHYVVTSISEAIREHGYRYSDVAILYRSNAQSRVLEESLLEANVPYRIYGGQKFFERQEIKDALSYLRLLSNRNDDAAFERVVNLPTRGIGNTTLNTLRETARDNTSSLWQAAHHLIEHKLLSTRALSALKVFLDLIDGLASETSELPLGEMTEHMLHRSHLIAHYKKDRSEKGLSRVENLEELISATSQYSAEDDEAAKDLLPLDAFLSHVALETGETQSEDHSNCVHLMTLHAAKGLEFPVVFITGLEENLFPHRMSTEDPDGLQEERRLCYVGMTRAMQKLIITHAESRRLYGMEKFNSPSRFIFEMPENLLRSVRPTTKISRPSGYATPTKRPSKFANENGTGLSVGQRVTHKKFGAGTILNFEGQDEHTRVQVKFDHHGTKWLVASYAKLQAA